MIVRQKVCSFQQASLPISVGVTFSTTFGEAGIPLSRLNGRIFSAVPCTSILGIRYVRARSFSSGVESSPLYWLPSMHSPAYRSGSPITILPEQEPEKE